MERGTNAAQVKTRSLKRGGEERWAGREASEKA